MRQEHTRTNAFTRFRRLIKSPLELWLSQVYDTHLYTPLHLGATMRTNVVLDDRLVEEAFSLTGMRTKKELIHLALSELVRARQKKDLMDLAGRIRLRKGFNHKSMREMRRGTR